MEEDLYAQGYVVNFLPWEYGLLLSGPLVPVQTSASGASPAPGPSRHRWHNINVAQQ